MHRYVQLISSRVDFYVEHHGLIRSGGCHYYDEARDENMYEFHVDACDAFLDDLMNIDFGGNLSFKFGKSKLTVQEHSAYTKKGDVPEKIGYKVDGHVYVHANLCSERFGDRETTINKGYQVWKSRPLVVLGHDECIFKQNHFSPKCWVDERGVTPLIPKDEGIGVMISAFQSREFGFGYRTLLPSELKEINKRRVGKSYLDVDAARKILGSHIKKPLKENPFCVFFDYGKNKEGYWTYDHFILQCEDVLDILEYLHPSFDFTYCVDNSCGHDRQQVDGLNAYQMGVKWGGKQRSMHSSKMLEEKGYLGQFPRVLNVGDVQEFNYNADSDGPFWLSAENRLAKRMDKKTGNKLNRDFNRSELSKKIIAKAPILQDALKCLNAAKVQELAASLSIPLSEIYDEVIPGWLGAPKGLRQVLWERGLIPRDGYNKYTKSHKESDFNLVQIMASCTDFLEETNLLQDTLIKRGVIVIKSPKCHAELAGEGIEYSWGLAKNRYRRLPYAQKRNKESFLTSVRRVISPLSITKMHVRKFARKARRYTCAYYVLDHNLKPSSDRFVDENGKMVIDLTGSSTLPSIERLVKQFKTHRCALDFATKFITTEANNNILTVNK